MTTNLSTSATDTTGAGLAGAGAEVLDATDFIAHMFEHQMAAVAAFDRSWRCTFWNERMELLTRIRREDAIGRTLQELFPALDPRDRACFEAALDGKRIVVRGRCYAAADVAERDKFMTGIFPLFDRAAVVGLATVSFDHPERGTLREQLQESEQRFRTMADCAPVLLWMAGTDSRCTFFNQTWLQFTGRTMEQEIGVGWAEGVHAEDFQYCMDGYMEAFRSRRDFELVYRLRRGDGVYRWVLDHGTPRFTVSGEFAGYIGSCLDITDLKEAQDVARRTIDRLARANSELERFASAASHDLQEPLRAMVSFTELLAKRYRDKLDPQAHEYIQFVVDGARRMKSLVDGLLEFARVKHSDPSTFKPTPVEAVVERALSNLQFAVKESGAEVIVEDLPQVVGSEVLLTQLFQNLLHNSIKFRGAAPPWIRVSAARDGEAWRIAVEDRGVGIDMRFSHRLFTILQRLQPRDEIHGNGIGLALCQRIVELHGGRIWIESQLGQGTTVYFTLPAAR